MEVDRSLTRMLFLCSAYLTVWAGSSSTYSFVMAQTPSDVIAGNSTFASRQVSEHTVFPPTQAPFVASVVSQTQPVIESEVLPGGLLYRSYIAAPHEPRFASVGSYDLAKKTWRWDATLGGRVGLFRQNQPQFLNLDAWQIDLEGATMTRLDPETAIDVESADYRFGLQWTAKKDNLSFKFGYFHISSHVGDEYLLKNPTFDRINYARESLVFGTSLQATAERRYYCEVAWANSVSGGAKPLQFQLGTEYAGIADNQIHGAPFAAVNLHLREETNFAAGLNLMTGWQWTGPDSGRTMRVGLQYYNGPAAQHEFFQRYDNQLGMGIWYDY